MARYFYRCGDCLSVTAADSAEALTVNAPPWPTCGACGGSLGCMGRVERSRLVHDGHRVPCDARCVDAPGPRCECQCGGENHGSGRLVAVVVDGGRVPQLTPVDVAVAQARAVEFRTARDRARAAIERRYGYLFEQKREGQWINGWGAYRRGCELLAGLRAVAGYRRHNTRLAALASLEREVAPEGAEVGA